MAYGSKLSLTFEMPNSTGAWKTSCTSPLFQLFVIGTGSGRQKDIVEHTEKPAPHTALSPPELPLSQRPFEAVLYQIISGISVAQEHQSVTVQMGDFAGNQPLQFI